MNIDEQDRARLQAAVSELRSERPPEYARDRAFDAMLRPKRHASPVRGLAVLGAAAVLAMVFLWPQRRAMAWDKVLQSTLTTIRLHHSDFEFDLNGNGWRHSGDEWFDGPKQATVASMVIERGQPLMKFDVRYDGKRLYRLDWTGYGVVYNDSRHRRFTEAARRFDLKALLTDPRLKVDSSPTEVTIDGVRVLRYRGKAFEGPIESGFSTPVAFYAEKVGGRLVRTEVYGRNDKLSGYSTIDYPSEISPSVFTPPSDGPRVFDLDEGARALKQSMSKGVPFGGGNVLRAVVQSPTGELLILWTGTPPNGDAGQHPEAVGYSIKQMFAPDQLTVSRWKCNPKSIYSFDGKTLCGIGLQLSRPVGKTVTLKMPILALDMARPVRNSRGAIVGHRSHQIGATTIKDCPVLETMPFTVLGYLRTQRPN